MELNNHQNLGQSLNRTSIFELDNKITQTTHKIGPRQKISNSTN